jgi:hypothetical protein
MRQVGARDEARITADYERCGQYCCCKNFLKVLKPVSMKSAKTQKATLDPLKISGRCGRLMCCLRYEDETYEDLRKRLPHRKSRVGTPDGDGIVIDTQILTQLALVRLDNGTDIAVAVENLSEPGLERAPEARVEAPARPTRERGPRPGLPPRPDRNDRSRADRADQPAARPERSPRPAETDPTDISQIPGDDAEAGRPTGGPTKKKRRRRRKSESDSGATGPGEPGLNGASPDPGRSDPPAGDRQPDSGPDDAGDSAPNGSGPANPAKKKRRRRRRKPGSGDSAG